MLAAARRCLARFDTNNPSTRPPKNAFQRSETASRNVVDTILFASNFLAAGTPLAWLTGTASVMVGVAKLIAAASIGTVAGKKGMIAAKIATSGTALVAGGITAFVPVAGHYVNASLAGLHAANAINASFPLDPVGR